jgi:hypothetical protein
MRALQPQIESAQKEVIWLHVRTGWHREWQKIRFTGATTMLRFLEAMEWNFVGLVIVWQRRPDRSAV